MLLQSILKHRLAFVLALVACGSVLLAAGVDAQNKRRTVKKTPPRKTTTVVRPTPVATPTPQDLLQPVTRQRRATPDAPPSGGDFEQPYDSPPLLVPERPQPGTIPTPLPTPTPPARPEPTPPKENTPVDDDEILRVETNLTNVLFTATDKNRRFLTGLKQEDIKIYEDGKPQEIFTFTRQTDLPLSLALLLDTSASEERTLPYEKEAATEFVNAVIRPNKDEIAVVSFTGESTLEQGLTGNIERARRAIAKVEFIPPSGYVGGGMVITGGGGTPPLSPDAQRRAGSTAIWDSIYVTADEILAETPDRTRRAVILLTDGVDTSSRWKRQEAIDRAVKNDAVIYCIGIGDDFVGGVDEGSLRTVSERTGGRAFFPRNEAELRRVFAQIQDELRSQYLVAYSSSNKNRDGSFRKVQIEVTNPALTQEKTKLTYRDGYFAKRY